MDEENDGSVGNGDAGMETNKCQVSSTGKRMNKCEPHAFLFLPCSTSFRTKFAFEFCEAGRMADTEWAGNQGME